MTKKEKRVILDAYVSAYNMVLLMENIGEKDTLGNYEGELFGIVDILARLGYHVVRDENKMFPNCGYGTNAKDYVLLDDDQFIQYKKNQSTTKYVEEEEI